jgi:hypothetical protein
LEISNIDYKVQAARLEIKKEKGKSFIFDMIRIKYVKLTPEELVRQLLIQHLVHELNYPKNKIAVEVSLTVNSLPKRCDVLVYDSGFNPFLLIECKAPEIKMDEKVFQQLAIYNQEFKVPYFLMTNGLKTFVGKINYHSKSFDFEDNIPEWTVG